VPCFDVVSGRENSDGAACARLFKSAADALHRTVRAAFSAIHFRRGRARCERWPRRAMGASRAPRDAVRMSAKMRNALIR
jgi:hypothetical protein